MKDRFLVTVLCRHPVALVVPPYIDSALERRPIFLTWNVLLD